MTLTNNSSVYRRGTDGRYYVATDESNSILKGILFDAVNVNFPNATTEEYEYYSGGLAGTLQATITVTYTDSTKNCISTVVRS